MARAGGAQHHMAEQGETPGAAKGREAPSLAWSVAQGVLPLTGGFHLGHYGGTAAA